MTGRVPFYFVDVFASRPLTGNRLSLVPDADDLSESQLRDIAREFTSVVGQGHALGRPSRIQVAVSGRRVRVGGSGLVVAEGTLLL